MTNTVNAAAQLGLKLKTKPEQINRKTGHFWSAKNQARLEESRLETEAGLLTEHELIEVN